MNSVSVEGLVVTEMNIRDDPKEHLRDIRDDPKVLDRPKQLITLTCISAIALTFRLYICELYYSTEPKISLRKPFSLVELERQHS